MDHRFDTISGIFVFFIGIVSSILNTLIIIGYIRSKTRASNCFVHITASNLIAGLTAVLLGVNLIHHRQKLSPDLIFCQISGFIINLNQISSPLLLTVATLERIFAIVNPVRFSHMSVNFVIYWSGLCLCWVWGIMIGILPYIVGHRMTYNEAWSVCDYKMADVLSDHTDAAYSVVVFIVGAPLILSWSCIVAGNAFVAAKLASNSIKRRRATAASKFSKSECSASSYGGGTTGTDNPVGRTIEEVTRKYLNRGSRDLELGVTNSFPCNDRHRRRSLYHRSKSYALHLTPIERKVIECTLSISLNYLILQVIFILQIFIYVFNPDSSVFVLLAGSPQLSSHQMRVELAGLWYYLAMPVTGAISTTMILTHNEHLRAGIQNLFIRTPCSSGGVRPSSGS